MSDKNPAHARPMLVPMSNVRVIPRQITRRRAPGPVMSEPVPGTGDDDSTLAASVGRYPSNAAAIGSPAGGQGHTDLSGPGKVPRRAVSLTTQGIPATESTGCPIARSTRI